MILRWFKDAWTILSFNDEVWTDDLWRVKWKWFILIILVWINYLVLLPIYIGMLRHKRRLLDQEARNNEQSSKSSSS